jgi:hypothetical protein
MTKGQHDQRKWQGEQVWMRSRVCTKVFEDVLQFDPCNWLNKRPGSQVEESCKMLAKTHSNDSPFPS